MCICIYINIYIYTHICMYNIYMQCAAVSRVTHECVMAHRLELPCVRDKNV